MFDLLMHKLSPDIMEVTATTAQACAFISVWCDPDQPDTDAEGRPYIYCLVKEFGGIVNRAQAVGLTLYATLVSPQLFRRRIYDKVGSLIEDQSLAAE